MRTDELAHRIQAASERVVALQTGAEAPAPPPELAAALQELQTLLGDLKAAQDHLRHQNEELDASRQTAEAQRQRYQDLFEFAPDGYLVTDMDGTIWEANQAADRLLNAPPGFLGRKPLVLFVAEEQRPSFCERLSQMRQVEQACEWEVRLSPRSGAPLEAAVKVAPIRDREGRLFGLRWLLRDVTEQKQVEERIRGVNADLERRVRERTEQLEAANQLKDEWLIREQAARADAEVAQWRLAFLAEAGISLALSLDDEAILDRVARLAVSQLADWAAVFLTRQGDSAGFLAVAHRDPSRVERAREILKNYRLQPGADEGVAKVLGTGESAYYPEISEAVWRVIAPEPGQRRALEELGARSAMVVPLTARGRILGALTLALGRGRRPYRPDDLALAEDFARRAGAAVDNARLFRELQEADRCKADFLATLAHELRSPLGPVRNALHILRRCGNLPPTARTARNVLERQFRRLARLVDDLLGVAEAAAGAVELHKRSVDLTGLVARAMEEARGAIEERRHELAVSLPPEPVFVDVDPARLEQILVNLLHNAAQHTEPGGRIEMSAGQVNGNVVLRVRDTGVGMAPENTSQVFDLFAQRERSREGLGVGLALVKNLVELHGGTVAAHSDGPGRGAEFTVRLPSRAAVGEGRGSPPGDVAAPGSRTSPDAGSTESRRVLLVDDNVDAAETLGLLLRLWGHDVQVAHEGSAALEAARGQRPDVVLLDIGLPGMSGLEIAQRLRVMEGMDRALFVALTGYGQERDRRRSQEAGFDVHLVKPVKPEVLQDILADAPRRAGSAPTEPAQGA